LRATQSIPVAASAADGPRLAFLAGFPGSGASLLEPALAAHPAVRTTGNASLLAPLLDENGRPRGHDLLTGYLQGAQAALGELDAQTTLLDRQALNLVYCRSIDAALPGARLLVALRDPRDVVLSCLTQRFRPGPAMANLDTLEDAVALYEEVMGLWLEARDSLRLPVLAWRYEDLVVDPRGTLAEVLAFLELPWTQAAEAAPRPEESGMTVGHWRLYRSQLAPVLSRLAPFVAAFGYEAE
jgi:hypothetical protein